jgi:hypothetical protein
MKSIIVSICVGCLLITCIDPIKLDADGTGGQLVVDGLITDVETTHQIKLSRSVNFNNRNAVTTYLVPENGAIVIITNDKNESIRLGQTQPGTYMATADKMKVEEGRTYYLTIKTTDGKVYESLKEKLNPVPPIQDIKYDFTKIEKISTTSGNIVDAYAFKISIRCDDPGNLENYYRWKAYGYIEFFSISEGGGSQCFYPVRPLETSILVSDDTFFNGNRFGKEIGLAPYERTTRMLVHVDQYSLTAEAFRFWKQVENQQKNTGSIFDATPAKIVGNVFNIDSKELVLGFFGVSAVAQKSVVFNRFIASDYTFPLNQKQLLLGDCTQQEPGATTNTPDGF